jgi:hypothetical protein
MMRAKAPSKKRTVAQIITEAEKVAMSLLDAWERVEPRLESVLKRQIVLAFALHDIIHILWTLFKG